MKDYILSAVVALAIVLGGVVLLNVTTDNSPSVGGVASPDVYSYLNVYGAFSEGGSIGTVATSGATYALSFSEMDDEKVIRVSPNGANLTLTLPASSSMPLFGGYRTWVIENATTAATTTTIAAGTGIDLQEPDGQNVIIGANNYAFVTCFREASTNVVCNIDETIPAD